MSKNAREIYYKIIGKDYMSRTFNSINGAALKTETRLGSLSRKTSSLKSNLRGAANEIPGLSSGLRFLGNPLTMAAGGVGLLAMGLSKATHEAAAFNNEYRELINLNLDKSPFQRQLLKSNILKTTAKEGFNPLQTSTAYYDVQSITGKYGYDVAKLVEKVGRFAKVMRADFNQTIAGSAQAMDIYGIKTARVDDYLASLYKTVLVGKTTFNELTKVQVEYANAASSVGQDYNTANKIYAAFSKTQKTAAIAATMTKTAFEDLTKKSTLKGLEKIGVKIFDAKNQMRGVDKILEDLIPKLKGMNDLEYSTLKEQIGGSEGIRGLLDMSRNSADKLLRSFKLFDETEFSMGDALKEARKDINFINDEINNKLKVSWINMGEAVLPVWVSIKQEILSGIDSINASMYEKMRSYYRLFNSEKYSELGLIRSRQHFDEGFGDAKNKYSNMFEGDLSKLTENDLKEKIDSLYTAKKKMVNPPMYRPLGWSKQDDTDDANRRQGYRKFFNKTIQALENNNFTTLSQMYGASGGSVGGNSGGGIYDNVSKGLSGIAGGGSQMKSVTVNIEKLNDGGINIYTTTLTESALDAEQQLTEMLMRAVGGAEQMIGS